MSPANHSNGFLPDPTRLHADVAECPRLEEQVERLLRQNELLLNSAVEGIYGLDVHGHTTFVNPAAARMLGWKAEELVGKPQHDLIHHTRPDGRPFPRDECPIYAALRTTRSFGTACCRRRCRFCKSLSRR